MSFPKDDNELDTVLGNAFAGRPAADFDAWQRHHAEAVACLDPRRAAVLAKKGRLLKRAVLLAAAAVVLVCVWVGISHFTADGRGNMAFAQMLEEMRKAKTFTWKTTFYERSTSKDGKRTWLEAETRERAYKSPGLYREVWFDEKGQVRAVEITDARQEQQRQLRLDPAKHEATLRDLALAMLDPHGPFTWVEEEIRDANLQWVATRKTPRGTVNVFRHSKRDVHNDRDWSYDFWIDEKTKRLVEVHVPGADIFDYDREPDRNNLPGKAWSMTALAFAETDIMLNAEVEDSLFLLEPPKGYAVTTVVEPRRSVTEKEMIDYLGVAADFNGKTFPDQVYPFAFSSARVNKACEKPEKDRTPAEQKLVETTNHYIMKLHQMPTSLFVEDNAVAGTFRYIGKGVKLGDKSRIVCWYRLKDGKDAKAYRVVYGDLSVRDAGPEDLPLPVPENRGAGTFAKTFEHIQKAKTMTWKSVGYEHVSTWDKKRTWAHRDVVKRAYKAPGLHRFERLDDNGQITQVEIRDFGRGRIVTLYPKEKKAVVEEIAPGHGDSGPLGSDLEKLNAPNLQWVGKRKTADGEVNVFRHAFRWFIGKECDYSNDFWIDAKTKQLVALYTPGADVYDPEHDPVKGNPPGDGRRHHIMGGGCVDIRYDVPLDDSLFSVEPPEGYAVEVKKPDRITEKEMIEYFGLVADFNDKTFPDQVFPSSWNLLEKYERAMKKPEKERAPAAQRLWDANMLYCRRFGAASNVPMGFLTDPDNIVKGSFRYLGKGVKLGDKNRIVCWYKLKGAKDPTTYRVLNGDLSVKDVVPKDLPLPIER
jgi:outer membrane lipoprotein-sorting protein